MGEAASGWGGKYRYRRDDQPDEVPHVPLHMGVMLLLPEHIPGLCCRIREERGIIQARLVVLTTSDERTLNYPHR